VIGALIELRALVEDDAHDDPRGDYTDSDRDQEHR
jgi:hypothetical protein